MQLAFHLFVILGIFTLVFLGVRKFEEDGRWHPYTPLFRSRPLKMRRRRKDGWEVRDPTPEEADEYQAHSSW